MTRLCIVCQNKTFLFGLPTDNNAQYCEDCKNGMKLKRKLSHDDSQTKRTKIDIWELL